jgi:hypothetical protein
MVRHHCYDVTGPFSLVYLSFKCSVHKQSISLMDFDFDSSVAPILDGVAEPLLLRPKTIITMNLWDKIVLMFIVSDSTSDRKSLTPFRKIKISP